MPEVRARCSPGQRLGTLTTDPTRAEASTEPARNPSQHTDYSDGATEYNASNAPRGRTPSPDCNEYSTQNTVYSADTAQPAQYHETTTDPKRQLRTTSQH